MARVIQTQQQMKGSQIPQDQRKAAQAKGQRGTGPMKRTK